MIDLDILSNPINFGLNPEETDLVVMANRKKKRGGAMAKALQARGRALLKAISARAKKGSLSPKGARSARAKIRARFALANRQHGVVRSNQGFALTAEHRVALREAFPKAKPGGKVYERAGEKILAGKSIAEAIKSLKRRKISKVAKTTRKVVRKLTKKSSFVASQKRAGRSEAQAKAAWKLARLARRKAKTTTRKVRKVKVMRAVAAKTRSVRARRRYFAPERVRKVAGRRGAPAMVRALARRRGPLGVAERVAFRAGADGSRTIAELRRFIRDYGSQLRRTGSVGRAFTMKQMRALGVKSPSRGPGRTTSRSDLAKLVQMAATGRGRKAKMAANMVQAAISTNPLLRRP